MKKFIYGLFGLIVIIFVFAYWALHNLVPNYLTNYINKELPQKSGLNISVKSIKSNFSHPLEIQFKDLQVAKQNEWSISPFSPKIKITLKTGLANFEKIHPQIEIELNQVKAKASTPPSSASQDSTSAKSESSLPIKQLSDIRQWDKRIKDLSLNLKVTNSRLTIEKNNEPSFDISLNSMNLELDSIDQPLKLSLKGQFLANNSPLPFWIPLQTDLQAYLNQGQLEIKNSVLNILNVKSNFNFSYHLNNKKINLDTAIQADDLQKIPLPQIEGLPIKSWKGSLAARILADGVLNQLLIRGSTQLKNADLVLQFKNEKFGISGPVKINLNSQFSYDQLSGQYSISKADWNINLTQAFLFVEKLFNKAAQVTLETYGQGEFQKSLRLNSFNLKLAQLDLSSQGVLSPQGPSAFGIDLKPAQLNGLEKIFLPLSKYPLTGEIALKADINGLLTDFKQLNIEVPSLNLKNLSTTIDFKNEDMFLKGPIKADIRGFFQIQGMNVKAGQASLQADLSGTGLQYKNLFRKLAQQTFSVKADVKTQKGKLVFNSSNVLLPFGQISLAGAPPLSAQAPMDLKIIFSKINLGQLGEHLPEYKSKVPKGSINSQIALKGYLNTDDLMKSPLTVVADSNVELDSFEMTAAKSASEDTTKPVDPKPAPAFLKDSPLIRQAQISTKLKLNTFKKDSIEATGLNFLTKVANSQLTVSGEVSKIFGGSIQIEKALVPLTTFNPQINFDFKTRNLDIDAAIKTFKPEFEKLVTGLATARVKGSTYLPGTPQFLENIQADVQMSLNKSVLNTIKVADMAKDLLNKIPDGQGQKLSQSGPLELDLLTDFKLSKGQIQFSKFDGLTARKEQLNLTGTANLKADLDLAGSLFIVDQVITGSFYEANKDSQGRLEIPLKIKGNAMKPEFSMAQETISSMLGKTVEFEKKKLMSQAQQQVQQQVEKSKDDLQKKLQEELKKKAGQLFK